MVSRGKGGDTEQRGGSRKLTVKLRTAKGGSCPATAPPVEPSVGNDRIRRHNVVEIGVTNGGGGGEELPDPLGPPTVGP